MLGAQHLRDLGLGFRVSWIYELGFSISGIKGCGRLQQEKHENLTAQNRIKPDYQQVQLQLVVIGIPLLLNPQSAFSPKDCTRA